jgi:hypothetical protein
MAGTDYVSLQELKNTAELVGFAFADYDAQMAINAAQRGIDEYTGRVFYSSSGTQQMFYEWTGDRCIETDDIVSLGTVEVDFNRDGVYETTWSQGTAFRLEPYNATFFGKPYEELGLLPQAVYYRPVLWPALIRITGTFGWPEVPAPVKEATTILAIRFLRRAREAPFGVVGLGVDNTAVRITKSDPDVAFLLDPFIKGQGVMAG